MSRPDVLVTLVNLGRPRRPVGTVTRLSEPVLADAATATRQLAYLLDRPITSGDLPELRALHRVAERAGEALLAGRLPSCVALNRLAHNSTGHVELAQADGTLQQQVVWTSTSPAAELARRLIEELATLEPSRLRRCARPECRLLFYDTTRSRTRRWHAEEPCGWRERQRRQRSRSASAGRGDPLE